LRRARVGKYYKIVSVGAIEPLAGEGEASAKEVVSSPGRDCDEDCDTFGRKGLVRNDFPTKSITERSNRYEKENYLYPLLARSYADGHLCVLRVDTQAGRYG
jgi:hypothetical protein